MKKILTFALIAAAGLLTAVAQQFATQSLYSSGTSTIAASGTTNVPANVGIVTARKNSNVGIEATFRMTGASTSNVTFTFARSLDGTRFESTPSVSIVVPANGTNAVTAATNVSLGALGALKLQSIANGSGSVAVTNAGVNVAIKPEVK